MYIHANIHNYCNYQSHSLLHIAQENLYTLENLCHYESHHVHKAEHTELENAAIKTDILPLIAAGLGCPQTPDILNHSTPAQQQHDTNWRQVFVVWLYEYEFMSACINNYCLDCRHETNWTAWSCSQSVVNITQVLMCYDARVVKHDSLIHHNITYLTCGGWFSCHDLDIWPHDL